MTGPAAAEGAALDGYLDEAIARGVTPGAVAWVAAGSRVLHRTARGHAQLVPKREPLQEDTPFDLASLTKPLVTAMLAAMLERDLDLRPDTPARALLPELDTLDHADITLRGLLAHRAGMPAWRPLFLRAETAAGYLRALRDEPLEARPGTRVIYSDPGYMAAGEMVARAAGATLDELFAELLAGPLGLGAVFRPGPEVARRAAATEVGQACERALAGPAGAAHTRWRDGVIRGQVHDHHAWVAGGVLGSAGLFAAAADLHRLGLELLGEGRGLVSAPARARLRQMESPPDGEARSEGFALNRGAETSAGPALSEEAFGHTGFTGASLWIDPPGSGIYILLTNRVHPRVREDIDLRAFRQGFHRRAAAIVAAGG